MYGSDSDKPGADLHSEWNLAPVQENLPGQLHPLPETYRAQLAMSPRAKFAQIKIQATAGQWVKVATVVPSPADIKPAGPTNRLYSLDVGPNVTIRFNTPTGRPEDHFVAPLEVEGKQTRAFARLKSGRRLPLTATAYRREENSAELHPTYEFDRDATTTEGDVIALSDVAAFEIESRTIKTGYLVVKLP